MWIVKNITAYVIFEEKVLQSVSFRIDWKEKQKKNYQCE